jgi:hypothetical protein
MKVRPMLGSNDSIQHLKTSDDKSTDLHPVHPLNVVLLVRNSIEHLFRSCSLRSLQSPC